MSRLNYAYYFLLTGFLFSCASTDETIGWDYNDPGSGGFQKVPYYEQETAPGMVLVEGAVLYPGNEDSLTIRSFYISKTEETNRQYLDYLSYLLTYYSNATYKEALPDSTVWFESDLFITQQYKMIDYYFRHPAYRDFPVIGLTPEQIKRYAKWKTDRLNEYILIREGVIPLNTWAKDSSQIFTTESYLNGTYSSEAPSEGLMTLNPENNRERIVHLEDGILLPPFRMVSEAEWNWAYRAVADSNGQYVYTPKSGYSERYDKTGEFYFLMDNAVRPGSKFHGSDIENEGVSPVYCFPPNPYGIYAMNGNVREVIGDSLGFGIAGGDTIPWKGTPKETMPVTPFDSSETCFYGFRLAMDRIGAPGPKRSYPVKSTCRSCIRKRMRMLSGKYSTESDTTTSTDMTNHLKLKRNGKFEMRQSFAGSETYLFGAWELLGNYVLLYPDQHEKGPLAVVYRLEVELPLEKLGAYTRVK